MAAQSRYLIGTPSSAVQVFATYDDVTLVIASITAINTDSVQHEIWWTWNGTTTTRAMAANFNQTVSLGGHRQMTLDPDGVVVPPAQLSAWGFNG